MRQQRTVTVETTDMSPETAQPNLDEYQNNDAQEKNPCKENIPWGIITFMSNSGKQKLTYSDRK